MNEIEFIANGMNVGICKSYAFTRGILEQPSTFSATVGNGSLARELIRQFKPLTHVEIKLRGTKLFDGVLEDLSSSGSASGTDITIQGRDNLRKLTKSYVLDEHAFGSPTFFELTKEVLGKAGYSAAEVAGLVAGNDANRKAATRVRSNAKVARQIIESVETNLSSVGGAKIKYEKVVGQIGQSWFDFLVEEYKKAGLYLWCGADGNLILARPTWDMSPIYSLRRKRGETRKYNNIETHSYSNRTSARHKWVRCYGKGKPDKKGQFPIYGDWHDDEMRELGFPDTDRLVIHNEKARNETECSYHAKRQLAEERRRNRTLSYTVYNHETESLDGSQTAIWAPDTMVRVDDDELSFAGKLNVGIHEDMYVEKVEFRRDDAGTYSTLHLMRKIDLLYLGEDPDFEQPLAASL